MSPVFFARRVTVVLCLLFVFSACDCRAHEMDSGATDTAAPSQSVGDALFAKVRSLIGTWDAPTKDGVLTDVFKPFAFDTAVLGEEWLNGKQITSTIFYVVNGELRADHYCDYKNQPRYTAVPAPDANVLDFEFRDATNLDTHPVHFHYTRWQLVDDQHLVQDWYIMGGKKPVSQAHLQFVRRAPSATGPSSAP
jgi:hypothetical protein